MFFKCSHPHSYLAVEKDLTVKKQDEDFYLVTLHLWCQKCNKPVKINYAKLIGGVDAFFERGREEFLRKNPR